MRQVVPPDSPFAPQCSPGGPDGRPFRICADSGNFRRVFGESPLRHCPWKETTGRRTCASRHETSSSGTATASPGRAAGLTSRKDAAVHGYDTDRSLACAYPRLMHRTLILAAAVALLAALFTMMPLIPAKAHGGSAQGHDVFSGGCVSGDLHVMRYVPDGASTPLISTWCD